MFPHQTIAGQLQAIRDKLDAADFSTNITPKQIGDIIIALSLLTDVVESLLPTPPPSDPYASARDEYAAERRIDEWAAYQRENERSTR